MEYLTVKEMKEILKQHDIRPKDYRKPALYHLLWEHHLIPLKTKPMSKAQKIRHGARQVRIENESTQETFPSIYSAAKALHVHPSLLQHYNQRVMKCGDIEYNIKII